VPGVDDLADKHQNVHVYRFPYSGGVSLATLMAQSICVALPYRKLTIHPQLNIAESMASGVATVSTDVESNGELIQSGRNGLLVPADDLSELEEAIRSLVEDPNSALAIGETAAHDLSTEWSWGRYTPELVSVYERVISQ
jgi:glycosyltransferase involved in cell wall biosynthesis